MTATRPQPDYQTPATPNAPGQRHHVPSDAPFFLALVLLGGSYVVLIVALVLADVGFLYTPGHFSQMTTWTWVPAAFITPFLALGESPEIRYSLWLSLISCAASALLSILVAVPLGYVMSRFRFRGKQVVDAIIDIPIVLPPLVLGLSLLILFQTHIGRSIDAAARTGLPIATLVSLGLIALAVLLWQSIKLADFGLASTRLRIWRITALTLSGALLAWLFVDTFSARHALAFANEYLGRGVTYAVPSVILAQFSVAAAFSVRTMRVTFDQISPRSEQVAQTLGCSRGQAFFRVVLPEARRGVLTAATLAWARALGEFGPILIFAGATRRRTEVLSTTVFLELSIGNLDAAVAVSLLMIAVALVVLILVRRLGGENAIGRLA